MSNELDVLRRDCPLPVLMHRLGYGRFARSSSCSPFRQDNSASWGIFQTQDSKRWLYKDLATGETGDEISFLAKVHRLDCKQHFHQLLRIYSEAAHRITLGEPLDVYPGGPAKPKPDLSALQVGTNEQLKMLSHLRGISMDGLRWASWRGLLKFGWIYDLEMYGVCDCSGLLAEVRRLDGLHFPARGGRMGSASKSQSLRHSRMAWPLGIIESGECECIALVEGMPDLLAMHQFVVEESASHRVAPVGMMTSCCNIADEALPFFQGKRVHLPPS